MLFSSLLIGIIIVFIVFYYLGIGFGNAVVNTTKGIRDAKKEWSIDSVNPIDTIKEQTKKIILDSLENKKN